ncbi:MAG TPA: DUF4382 domain-containing protein [Vicinamibacterales bacterium]|jgi:hypothetical protein
MHRFMALPLLHPVDEEIVMMNRRLALPLFACAIGGLVACGNSSAPSSSSASSPTAPSSGPSPAAPTGTATFSVMLTDSPFTDAKALLLTFSEVSAHSTGGDWKTLAFVGGATSRTCDLKKLTGPQDVLGTGPLAAGHYTQIRLVVASAVLYFDNPSVGPACAPAIASPAGKSADVTIPSGEVKLNREFDLTSSNATTMVLDFDGDQSVHETGNGRYMMSPVVGIVSVH